jgi:hypothetical protein
MAKIPVYDAIRIIPRDIDFLNRKVGNRGEIFYDKQTNTLILFNGDTVGGTSLAKSDLSNIANSTFLAKATAAGVSSSGGAGNVTVSVSNTVPSSPTNGNLWLNTETGILYVYINDGNSNQWIQPAVPAVNIDLTGLATETFVTTAIDNIPEVNLTGLATETYVNTAISDLLASSAETIQTLNELTAALEDDEFATAITNEIGLKAPINNPTFTGTVNGITATMVGLGNVTNESKTTMFSSPTFTGTVSGVTATHVGLGNVTNESKATMFSSPTFTGTVSGVTATHVGLGNVTNESKATMFASPTFTGTVTNPGVVTRAVSAAVTRGGLGISRQDIVDTFLTSTYRTAVYHLQCADATFGFQYNKITLIHDGTTVTLIDNDVVFTSGIRPYMVYDCNISSGTATLTVEPVSVLGSSIIKGWVEFIGV